MSSAAAAVGQKASARAVPISRTTPANAPATAPTALVGADLITSASLGDGPPAPVPCEDRKIEDTILEYKTVASHKAANRHRNTRSTEREGN